MLDLSENGRQIGEKLFTLLRAEQQQEFIQFILNRIERMDWSVKYVSLPYETLKYDEQPLTEIREGELYFCPELRKVCIGSTEIELTVKEFDALQLLILNQKRVLTFEILAYHIWGEGYTDVTAKTIHNLMGRLRQKLQIKPNGPEYIISIRGVGYKFDAQK